MAVIPDLVQPVASLLLTQLCCRLAGSDYPVCRCAFGFGAPPPISACCECDPEDLEDPEAPIPHGEAWVRVGPVVATEIFPEAVAGPIRCDMGLLAAEFTVGIYRCAPTMDDQGEPPTPEDLAEALTIQLQDRAMLFRVVRCALNEADYPYVLGTWEPLDPQGGCMGSQMTVTVAISDCLACPECPEEGPE